MEQCRWRWQTTAEEQAVALSLDRSHSLVGICKSVSGASQSIYESLQGFRLVYWASIRRRLFAAAEARVVAPTDLSPTARSVAARHAKRGERAL